MARMIELGFLAPGSAAAGEPDKARHFSQK
jgi:hypothetical protein